MNNRLAIRQSFKIPDILDIQDFREGEYLWVSREPMNIHHLTMRSHGADSKLMRVLKVRTDDPIYNGWFILERESGYRRSYCGEADALTDAGYAAWKLVGFRYV